MTDDGWRVRLEFDVVPPLTDGSLARLRDLLDPLGCTSSTADINGRGYLAVDLLVIADDALDAVVSSHDVVVVACEHAGVTGVDGVRITAGRVSAGSLAAPAAVELAEGHGAPGGDE